MIPAVNQPGDSNDESAEIILDPALPLSIDMNCLNCGYNLRGLFGNPIRCPECFHHSPRLAPESLLPDNVPHAPARDEVILGDLVSRGSIVAVALAFPLVFGLGLSIIEGGWALWLIPTVAKAAGVVGPVGFWLFSSRCRGVDGWFAALCRYLVIAVVSISINIVLIGLVSIGAGILFRDISCAFITLSVLLFGVFFINPMVSLNSIARDQLRPIAERILLSELESDQRADR